MEAFSRNGVRYIRLEGVNGQGKKEGVVKRFQEDPDIAAFLLHTKSQAAGLNLTVARYVFLVEPLLHPSLEVSCFSFRSRDSPPPATDDQEPDPRISFFASCKPLLVYTGSLRPRTRTCISTPSATRSTAVSKSSAR